MSLPNPTFIGQQITVNGKTYQCTGLNPVVWKGITTGTHGTRLQNLEGITLQSALESPQAMGTVVTLKDRGYGRFMFIDPATATNPRKYYIKNEAETIALELIRTGSEINPEWFGLVYDGDETIPTDNKQAIDDMHDMVRQGIYPERDGGLISYRGDATFATSGGHILPQCNVEGNNVHVRPLGTPQYIFKLDARHPVQNGRFIQHWNFGGFILWSDRGFTETTGLDLDHFLILDAGWYIRCSIYDIGVLPGFSARSLCHCVTTHDDLPSITEVGVPDAITWRNISAQYALNTSFAISFTGDQLGTGSRHGSQRFFDIYNSISYPKDFETRGNTTNDFGVIRLDDVRLSRCEFHEIYGIQPIKMFGDSSITGSIFNRVYVEFNNSRVSDFETMFRSGTYTACEFHNLNMYTLNTNLSAPPRFFFARFERCTFYNITAQVQSVITNAPDSNFIDLVGAGGSYGNIIKNSPRIVIGIGVDNPPVASMAYTMTKMRLPKDTKCEFAEERVLSRKAEQLLSGEGTFTMGVVDNDITDVNPYLTFSCEIVMGVDNQECDVQPRFGGDGMTSFGGGVLTGGTRRIGGASGHVYASKVDIILQGTNNDVANPTFDVFQGRAVGSLRVMSTGADVTTDPSLPPYPSIVRDVTVQRNSGDFEIQLTVSNKTVTDDIRVLNAELKYGYSLDYINWV